MARTVALSVLRARVRRRADIETDAHLTDAEVDDNINESIAAQHSMIVEAGEDDFLEALTFETEAGVEEYDTPAEATGEFGASFDISNSITTGDLEIQCEDIASLPTGRFLVRITDAPLSEDIWASGTSATPYNRIILETPATLDWEIEEATIQAAGLVSNVYKYEHVEALIGGEWAPLERWQFNERHLYENASSSGWGDAAMARAYRITGRETVRLLPVPEGVYTVRLWVHTAATKLVEDSDTYDGRDGWEEWVVLDAAIKCGLKAEMDVSAMIGEREKAEARFKPQARSKDRMRPARVVDVERRRSRLGWDY